MVDEHLLVDPSLGTEPRSIGALGEYEVLAESSGSGQLAQFLHLGTEEDIDLGLVGVEN